jgi:hypothetical protein
MPTVEMDVKPLASAVRQLDGSEFRQFLKELSDLSRFQFARHRDEKTLRAAVNYRLPACKQKRLSALLAQGNEGTLSYQERAVARQRGRTWLYPVRYAMTQRRPNRQVTIKTPIALCPCSTRVNTSGKNTWSGAMTLAK